MKPDQKKEQQAKCEHDYPKNQCELCNAVYLDMNKAKCEHECTCDVAGIRLGESEPCPSCQGKKAAQETLAKCEQAEWEYFCDESYYHLWCVRLKTDRAFGEGFHTQSEAEAKGLCEILNSKLPPAKESLSINAVVDFLDSYPIKSALCFDITQHECGDLAEEFWAKFSAVKESLDEKELIEFLYSSFDATLVDNMVKDNIPKQICAKFSQPKANTELVALDYTEVANTVAEIVHNYGNYPGDISRAICQKFGQSTPNPNAEISDLKGLIEDYQKEVRMLREKLSTPSKEYTDKKQILQDLIKQPFTKGMKASHYKGIVDYISQLKINMPKER